jgi:hypothetical protein
MQKRDERYGDDPDKKTKMPVHRNALEKTITTCSDDAAPQSSFILSLVYLSMASFLRSRIINF